MNLTAILSLPVICQLNCLRALSSYDANFVVSIAPAISNQSLPPVQPTTLPDGYIAYPEIGTAYKIIFNEVDWSEAREQCNLEGAHLAILDSQRKLEYVWNTVYDTYHRTAVVQMHTGIYRMDHKWVDLSTGKTQSDLPWGTNYPVDSSYYCAIAQLNGEYGGFLHNSYDCSHKCSYICEVPIPKDYKTQENHMARIPVN